MHVEQRLTTCEVCSRSLAVQYHWGGDAVPSPLGEPIVRSFFACPACRHENPMLVLLHAHSFLVKVIPGPDVRPRVEPNTLRRLWLKMPDRVEHSLGFRAAREGRPGHFPHPPAKRSRLEALKRLLTWAGVLASSASG